MLLQSATVNFFFVKANDSIRQKNIAGLISNIPKKLVELGDYTKFLSEASKTKHLMAFLQMKSICKCVLDYFRFFVSLFHYTCC